MIGFVLSWRLKKAVEEVVVVLDEPDISIPAAADVVEAMAVAVIGNGWLCVPS